MNAEEKLKLIQATLDAPEVLVRLASGLDENDEREEVAVLRLAIIQEITSASEDAPLQQLVDTLIPEEEQEACEEEEYLYETEHEIPEQEDEEEVIALFTRAEQRIETEGGISPEEFTAWLHTLREME
jgi:hypothetical protein